MSLYCGDNLPILKSFADASVDLIYLDPPFNSGRNYFQADKQAFEDSWQWGSDSERLLEQMKFRRGDLALFLDFFVDSLGKNALSAYLVMMAARLVELYRVLKPTGSLYLHCDPTSSHYIKLILDSVFCAMGGDFLNEIIWCYRGGGSPKKDFGRRHDIIFRYSKGKEYIFNADFIRIPYQAEGFNRKDDAMWGKHKGTNKVYKPNPLGKVPEDWWLLNPLNSNDPERLGYPTQKPEALLERIIQASSNPGDVVLDPFCGSGTTLAVAQKLGRNWIGIDMNPDAIELTRRRLDEPLQLRLA